MPAPGAPARNPLLRRQVGIDRRERLLGLEHRVAELDKRIARRHVHGRAGCRGDRQPDPRRPSFLPSARARSAPRSSCRRPVPPGSARHPGARWRGAGRPPDAPETIASATFSPIPATVSRCRKSCRFGCIGEAVELQRILADVQVRLDDRLTPGVPRRAQLRGQRRRAGSRHRSRRARSRRGCEPSRFGPAASKIIRAIRHTETAARARGRSQPRAPLAA